MKRLAEMFIVLVVCLVIATPTLTLASSSPRLIPTGTVSLLSEGKEVNQFKSEMPLPEGLLMVKSGTCMVQTEGLQVVGQEQAVFGLSGTEQGWDATVQSGRLDFAMAPGTKSLVFHTPHDTLQAQRAVEAVDNEGVIRGFITVGENGTELTLQEGTLQVASKDGSKLVKPGETVLLAGAAGAVAAGAGLSTTTVASGAGAAAAVVGGVAAGVALSSGDSVTKARTDLSPF